MYSDFSNDIKLIILDSQTLSKSKGLNYTGTEYMLISMFKIKGSTTNFILDEYSVTLEELQEEVNKFYILRKKQTGNFSSEYLNILEEAHSLIKKDNQDKVEEEHLFLAILNNENCIAHNILLNIGLSISDLKRDLQELYESKNEKKLEEIKKQKGMEDLCELYARGQLSPYVDERNYIDSVEKILYRKNKNNCILVGKAGVGKTAIVEGLAAKFVNDKSKYKIFDVQVSELVSGSKYRGDFEDKLLKIINEVKNKSNIILFFDEIHTLVGAGSSEGSLDASNILKPYLARGEINCIGATTHTEYRKYFEKDKALMRRFKTIFVEEPSIEVTNNILNQSKENYEKFHDVYVENDCISMITTYCDKYISQNNFPDKAFDLLEEVMVYAKLNGIERITTGYLNSYFKKNSTNNLDLTFKEEIEYIDYIKTYSLGLYKVDIVLQFDSSIEALDTFSEELCNYYNLSLNNIFKIDLEKYNDKTKQNELFGSPPGYVGYEDSGEFIKFIKENQKSIVIIDSFFSSKNIVKTQLIECMNTGIIKGNNGDIYKLGNTIFIINSKNSKEKLVNIGFDSTKSDNKDVFFVDFSVRKEVDVKKLKNYNLSLISSFSDRGYLLKFDFEVTKKIYKDVCNLLFELITNNEKGEYKITKEDNIYKYIQ